jgi:S-adenosylmethionine:tRNA ribosyltransferase-isomerase
MTEIPGYIDIQDYTYTLPEGRIARYPLESRDSSKLLFFRDGLIESRIFRELPDILSDKHHLVFNDTKVIQARLIFVKSTGATIEVFLLEPWFPSEYNLSFSSKKECVWKCLVGNAKKWKNGIIQKEIWFGSTKVIFCAEKSDQHENYYYIRFYWDNATISFSELLENAGTTPIPPYLEREADEEDSVRYQTVYSRNSGSVAAPTAGLHFTSEVLQNLEKAGCLQTRITLHVGAGTFVPVKVQNAAEHEMHTEHFYISRSSLESLYQSDKKFIAVGTTSVRALESLYHVAIIVKENPGAVNNLYLDQWDAYQTSAILSRKEALECLLEYMDKLQKESLKVSTRIMIVPGYKFRMIQGMITNFHQPNSTLLLLVAAFIGEEWKKVYDFAIKNNFRFLSYGDSSILLK